MVLGAAIHVIMLNSYDSYLPNNTLDVTVNGVSQVLFGNSGGPSFPTGNYPQVGDYLLGSCPYVLDAAQRVGLLRLLFKCVCIISLS